MRQGLHQGPAGPELGCLPYSPRTKPLLTEVGAPAPVPPQGCPAAWPESGTHPIPGGLRFHLAGREGALKERSMQ